MDSTDTLYINMAGQTFSRVLTPNIAVGDTVNDLLLKAWGDSRDDETFDACLFFMADWNTSIVDSFSHNDSSCVSFILKGGSTGIRNLNPLYPKELSLYPNPAHTNVIISPKLDKQEDIMVYVKDIMGRLCLERQIKQWSPAKDKFLSIDISAFKAGIYLVELKTKEARWMGKLIVE